MGGLDEGDSPDVRVNVCPCGTSFRPRVVVVLLWCTTSVQSPHQLRLYGEDVVALVPPDRALHVRVLGGKVLVVHTE